MRWLTLWNGRGESNRMYVVERLLEKNYVYLSHLCSAPPDIFSYLGTFLPVPCADIFLFYLIFDCSNISIIPY